MRDLLYRKKGRRYEPVGPEFTGFPADGIWLVERDGRGWRLFMRFGDAPEPAVMDRAALERRRDEICRAINQVKRDGAGWFSPNDIASAVMDVLARKEES